MIEFDKHYLTFEEYRGLGGTLEMTPFNILELKAQKEIDKYTFGRLKNLDSQINEVKLCMYDLISALDSYSTSNQNKSILSESIDGYSVNYGGSDENFLKTKVSEIKGIIKTYLTECRLEDGTPYLYIGVDRYAKKQ